MARMAARFGPETSLKSNLSRSGPTVIWHGGAGSGCGSTKANAASGLPILAEMVGFPVRRHGPMSRASLGATGGAMFHP